MGQSAGNDLIQLIQSMDRAEKWYFRLYVNARQNRPDKNYHQFYDHLLQSARWDEAQIRSTFAGAPFLRQLNVYRDHLYHLLLDSLRSFHRGKTIQSDFSRRMEEIELLFQRKLYPACARALSAGIRKAQLLQLPAQELEIRKWELRWLRQTLPQDMAERITSIHQRMQHLLWQVSMEIRLTEGVDQLAPHLRNIGTGAAPGWVLQWEQSFGLQAIPLPSLSFDGRLAYHHIEAYLGILKGDSAAYFSHHESLFRVWEANPDRIRLEQDRYFRLLASFAESCTRAEKHHLLPKVLAKLRRVLDRSDLLGPQERARFALIELQHQIAVDDWQAALQLIPNLATLLQKYHAQISALIRVGIGSNAIFTLAVNRKWQEVLHWGTILHQAGTPRQGPGTIPLLRVASWMAWYSLGQHAVLESDLKPARLSGLDTTLQTASQYLQRLVACQSAAEEVQVFRAFHQALEAAMPEPPQPHLVLLGGWIREMVGVN